MQPMYDSLGMLFGPERVPKELEGWVKEKLAQNWTAPYILDEIRARKASLEADKERDAKHVATCELCGKVLGGLVWSHNVHPGKSFCSDVCSKQYHLDYRELPKGGSGTAPPKSLKGTPNSGTTTAPYNACIGANALATVTTNGMITPKGDELDETLKEFRERNESSHESPEPKRKESTMFTAFWTAVGILKNRFIQAGVMAFAIVFGADVKDLLTKTDPPSPAAKEIVKSLKEDKRWTPQGDKLVLPDVMTVDPRRAFPSFWQGSVAFEGSDVFTNDDRINIRQAFDEAYADAKKRQADERVKALKAPLPTTEQQAKK